MPEPMPMPQGAAPQAPPPGPVGAPMAQPMANEGSKQMALVQAETAIQMLEMALPKLGSNTKEGEGVRKALDLLTKLFGRSQAQQLVPAQIAELVRAQQKSPIQSLMAGGEGQAPAAGQQPPQPMAA